MMRLSKLLGAFFLALTCIAPVPAQIAYPGVPATGSDLRDDGRRLWVSADVGGRFVYLGNGRWLGADARSRSVLHEARRTPDSIELHGPRLHRDILLLNGAAYIRPPNSFQWQPLAVGGWQ
jgi:hypothetical protein